jgi:hypothetical protein
MLCGRCCVMEPPSRAALQLDIFIEILLRKTVNRAAERLAPKKEGSDKAPLPASVQSITRLLDGLRSLVVLVHVAEGPRPDGGAWADEQLLILGVRERSVRRPIGELVE